MAFITLILYKKYNNLELYLWYVTIAIFFQPINVLSALLSNEKLDSF
jgi:hypothetical protein